MRPMPVWISSAMNSVPYLRHSAGSARQELVGGQVDALALDRLDDEGRDLARRQRLLERREIVEGNRRAARQQRLEAAAEVRIVHQRQRAVGQAVKRMASRRRCRDGRSRRART